ncbi:50S ribosomal protein L17 [Pontiella agarivorans]|uniref:50S ribosomal protein L17 n=1 Tax=Pontiella agarivorans TaxID=3038953 RepID=UPI002AD4A9DA|nr:50S ribosomal protein L17 [Pontiella agarivorans]
MRHRKKTVKLGRTSAHRNELLANQVCALIDNKRIKTTAPKAKAARSLAEKMVTLGKKGTLAARRQAIAILKNEAAVKELFDSVAPTFESRNGGYTRIIKLGRRISDSSEMVLLEWVDAVVTAAPAADAVPADEEKEVAAAE